LDLRDWVVELAATLEHLGSLSESGSPDILAAHLSAPEADCEAHSKSLIEELLCTIDLHFKVVLSGVGAKTNLFWGAVRRVLATLPLHTRLFVLVFAVVEELADGWPGVWGDFDKVEP
jgi:hypothetical protein